MKTSLNLALRKALLTALATASFLSASNAADLYYTGALGLAGGGGDIFDQRSWYFDDAGTWKYGFPGYASVEIPEPGANAGGSTTFGTSGTHSLYLLSAAEFLAATGKDIDAGVDPRFSTTVGIGYGKLVVSADSFFTALINTRTPAQVSNMYWNASSTGFAEIEINRDFSMLFSAAGAVTASQLYIQANTNLTIASGKTLTLSACIVGGAGRTINFSGGGTLKINTANTGTSIIRHWVISGGSTLDFSPTTTVANAIGSLGYGSVTLDRGNIKFAAGTYSLQNNFIIGAGGGTITGGTGTYSLTGGQYTFATTTPGTLTFDRAVNLGSSGQTFNFSAGISTGTYTLISAGGAITATGTKTVTGLGGRQTVAWDTATTGQLKIIITGSSANLTWKGGSGTWGENLTTDATWDSVAALTNYHFLAADLVTIGKATDAAGVGGTITLASNVNAKSATVTGAADWTLTSAASFKMTGTGSLVKEGTGTLTLNGSTNTYSGGTTVNGGTLNATTSSSLGTGLLVVNNGGVANISATQVITGTSIAVGGKVILSGAGSLGTSAVVNNGTLEFAKTASTFFSNVISGTGSVVQSNTGTTWLRSAANSYSGTTTVSAGTLYAEVAAAFGTSKVILNGGTLNLYNQAVANDITYNSGEIASGYGAYVGTLTLSIDWTQTEVMAAGATVKATAGTTYTMLANATHKVNYSGGTITNLDTYAGMMTVAADGLVLDNTFKASVTVTSGVVDDEVYPFTLTLAGMLSANDDAIFTLGALINNGNIIFDLSGSTWENDKVYTLLTTSTGLSSPGSMSWTGLDLGDGATVSLDYVSLANTVTFMITGGSNPTTILPGTTTNVNTEITYPFTSIGADGVLNVGTGGSALLGAEGTPATVAGAALVSGGGMLTVAETTLVDAGKLIVGEGTENHTGVITITKGTGTGVVNSATLTADESNASLINFDGDVLIIIANGIANVTGGIKGGAVVIVDVAGTLKGVGEMGNSVTVLSGGTHLVGNSPGLVSTGIYTVHDGGVSDFSFVANESGTSVAGTDFSQLTVTTLSLYSGAIFNLSLEGAGVDEASDIFTYDIVLFDALMLNGTNATLAEGNDWLAANANMFQLEDGMVFGGARFVDAGSGKSTLRVTMQYVPEPTTATLGILGLAGLLLRRRRTK